jgi:hypothetical protein
MRNFRTSFLITAACAACLLGCASDSEPLKPISVAGLKNPSIRILVDRSQKAPVVGSFGWGYCFFRVEQTPDLNLSAVNERLHLALRSELARKGLTFSDSNPDIIVSYALASGAEIDDEELNKAYGDILNAPAAGEETDLHYKRGVLVLDIVDRKSKHLLWRGAIMAEIDMAWPEERKQERCEAVISELLRHYPRP